MSEYLVYLNSPEKHSYPTNEIRTTKYSIVSFIPKSIFFQFQRLANLYFLATAVLQCFPTISPLNPFTAIGPLALVLLIAMIKEAIEDWRRRQNDSFVNHCRTLLWKENKWTPEEWKNLKAGQVVMVREEEEFPADLVILTSSEENADCKIQTANLDGERNLKTKQASNETIELFEGTTLHPGVHLKLSVNPPDARLDYFRGKVSANRKKLPVDKKQLLLRVRLT